MDDNSSTYKRKPCIISAILILISLFLIANLIQCGMNYGRNTGSNGPSLFSRKATVDDIYLDINDNDIVSIQIVVIPEHDINDLEITVYYYSESNKLLKTNVVNFGDVSKNVQYTKNVSITNFTLSQIFEIRYCRYKVTDGTISSWK